MKDIARSKKLWGYFIVCILFLYTNASCTSCGSETGSRTPSASTNSNSHPEYSIDCLRGTCWVTTYPDGTIISKIYFTDTTIVTVRIFEEFGDSHITENRYYLSDESQNRFDSLQVGKGSAGKYISTETGRQRMMSWEIISISNDEMRLLLQEKEPSIGGRDTATYRRCTGNPNDDTMAKSCTDSLDGTSWTATYQSGNIITEKRFTDRSITTITTYKESGETRTTEEEYYMSMHKPLQYDKRKVGTHTKGDYMIRPGDNGNILASKIISISPTEMVIASFPDNNQTIGRHVVDTVRYTRIHRL